MKRKVAFILPSLRGGGAERVITNIIKSLDHNKFDISLILLKKEGPYLDLLPNYIRVVDLNTFRVRNSIIPLINAINKIKPDTILSTMGHLNLLVLATRFLFKGNPKVIVREANTPSKRISKKERILIQVYKYLYSKADLIIAQCNEMKHDIMKVFNIKDEKIVYIYNPLDIEAIKEQARKKNPFNPNKVNFLSVGRLTVQKGFDILINAFAILVKETPNAHLTILGEGNLKQELMEQAVTMGIEKNISFVGFKSNPYPYYKYADVYVLSSRWEGFPNSLLEALACGTKIVATNCKSGPREIIGDNEFGTLVSEGDYESLANGIIKSVSEKNKTGDRAQKFHIKRITRQYEKIL